MKIIFIFICKIVSVVRSRPRPTRPAPPSPQPPRRPPPPERLAKQLDNSHIHSGEGNGDSAGKQTIESVIPPSGDVVIDGGGDTSDTFDLFANFPPPPSKTTPLPANPLPSVVDKPSDGNLLFPEDDSFGDFLSGVSREGETTQVLTGNLRGQMKIWDLRSQSNSPTATFLLSGDQVAATSIVHHPTQRHLVLAGSENGALAVWDLRVNTYPASLLNAHSAAVSEIQFHPDHPQRLFTCSASGEIWHWNTATMSKQITTTMNASLAINESTINPWLMSDEDRANLEVVSLMSDLHKPINSIDCNKNRVLCGCDNEAVYLIKDVYT